MDWIELGRLIRDLLPVWTALITAAATLGAVWITQVHTTRRERARLVDERRDREVADLRTGAVRVSELLLAEGLTCDRISTETKSDDEEFLRRYEAHLYGGALQEIGHAVAMLPDGDAREQIQSVLRELPDAVHFPDEFGVPIWRIVAPILLTVAGEISNAYARGERPDLEKIRRYNEIREASQRLNKKVSAAYARALSDFQTAGAMPPEGVENSGPPRHQ